MLVLHSTSRCDVCLVEYNWETSAKVPHAIACGHIFCRDCLYATHPPLCPLCRKAYLPAKIKKLHVDRPENVDEARDEEVLKMQVRFIERLAGVWEGLGLVPGGLGGPTRARQFLTSGNQHEDEDEDEGLGEEPDGTRPFVPISDEWEGHEEEYIIQRVQEGPLANLFGMTAGGSTIRSSIPSAGAMSNELEMPTSSATSRVAVTMREALQMQRDTLFREVDIWLEDKEVDECTALRKSRLFLNRHLEVIESARKVREELQEELQDALEEELRVERQRSEEKLKEMEDDKEEMQRMRDLERKAERENEERWVYESEGLKNENTSLKAQISVLQAQIGQMQMQSQPQPHTPSQFSSHAFSPSQRNPLPAPPEPVPTDHLPTFAQAVSETGGSIYSGSVYGSGLVSGSIGVRFAELAPSPPPRAKERYGPSDESHPSASSSSKKKNRKSASSSASISSSHASGYSPYSYRGDSGYFEEDEEDRYAQPTSAPAAIGSGASHTPTPTPNHSRGNGHGAYSTRGSTSALPLTSASTSQPSTAPTYTTNQSQSQPSSYATRSAGLPSRFENTTQPLDVYTLTGTYLREYSVGFQHGQEAAKDLDRFGYSGYSQQPFSAPITGSSSRERAKTDHRRHDTAESIISTTESASGHTGRLDTTYTTNLRPRSRSSSRSRSQYSDPVLASILNTSSVNSTSNSELNRPASRRPIVPLPPSSNGQPSPAVSFNSNQIRSSRSDNLNALGLEVGASPRTGASNRSSFAAPDSLPDDPAEAAALLNGRHASYNRPTESVSSWGEVMTDRGSNSLIHGLIGLPRGGQDDNASVRTRGTRETRFSIASSAALEGGDRDSVRDSRRESMRSEALLSLTGGDGSPVRPVQTMVGVLPVDEYEREREEPSSSSARSSSYLNSYRSSTALDSSAPTTSTSASATSSHGYIYTQSQGRSQTQTLPRDPPPMPIPPPPTQSQTQAQLSQAQQVAASTGWGQPHTASSTNSRQRHSLGTAASSSSSVNLNTATMPVTGYFSEYERQPSSSRRRDREHRDRTRPRESGLEPVRERDRERDRDAGRDRDVEVERADAFRASTSIGMNTAHGYNSSRPVVGRTSSSASWMWDSDSNVYPSPVPPSSSDQISPHTTSFTPTSASNLAANRDRDRTHRSHRPRHNHTHSDTSTHSAHGYTQSQNHRPSLLSIESSPFPVSVETTDDERYGYGSKRSGNTTGSSTVTSGRTTRASGGNSTSYSNSHFHSNSQSTSHPTADIGSPHEEVHGPRSPELQSFGNALGLELSGTVETTGISAPRPVASTQRFLRSFSQGGSVYDRD